MKLGDATASERALAAGLANCPSSPGLHLERGRRLNAAGRFSEAIKEFQEVIRLRPQEAEGYADLANAFFHLSRIDEGVAELRKSLQVEPENPMALTTLAFFAIRTGDQNGATEWLRHNRGSCRTVGRHWKRPFGSGSVARRSETAESNLVTVRQPARIRAKFRSHYH